MRNPETLEEDFEALLNACPSRLQAREIGILEALFGLKGDEPQTLAAVGAGMGLTRERIRQLRNRALEHLRDALVQATPVALSLAREVLLERRGICDLRALGAEVCVVLPAREYRPAVYLRWLIELLNHPELRVIGDGTVIGPPLRLEELEAARRVVRKALARRAGATLERLCDDLAEIWPDADPGLLAQYARVAAELEGYEVMPGLFARRPWARTEWAEFVLEQEGRPLHFREIARRVNKLSGRKYHEAGFDWLLNTYPAFVRVGHGDFALSMWGARRYGRFDEVIASYLTEQCGAVHESQIKADLLKVYTVKESTVAAMLRWPPGRFVYFGGGYWSLVGQAPRVDAQLERIVEQQLRALGRAATSQELAERVFPASQLTPERTEKVRRILYLGDRFRLVGSYRNPKFLLAADVKASPGERAADMAVRVLQDFKHPMSLGELVGRVSQGFFAGRHTPSSENLRLRLSAHPDVEQLGGLYRAKGKQIFA